MKKFLTFVTTSTLLLSRSSTLASAQIGNVVNPFTTLSPGVTSLTGSASGSGLIALLTNLLRFTIVMAGIYTLFNFVIAGYQFLSAGGEPKNISKAWEKIWQSMLGLLIVAGSLLLAAITGYLIFGNTSAIISPKIYAP